MTDEEKTTVPAEAEAAVETEVTELGTDEATEEGTHEAPVRRRLDWPKVVAYGVLPALALVLALTAGYFKYVDSSVRNADVARSESTQAARDGAIRILSYAPDTVEQELNDARSVLTGEFSDSYASLINEVVIPGAKQQQISAVASVPAAASVSADPNRAVVLVFVNQTVVVGADPPTDTASSVRVTLDKVGDQWLISAFEPV